MVVEWRKGTAVGMHSGIDPNHELVLDVYASTEADIPVAGVYVLSRVAPFHYRRWGDGRWHPTVSLPHAHNITEAKACLLTMVRLGLITPNPHGKKTPSIGGTS